MGLSSVPNVATHQTKWRLSSVTMMFEHTTPSDLDKELEPSLNRMLSVYITIENQT